MQNATACVQLYYINCMYNSGTGSCDPVKASFCQSLPVPALCAANNTCVYVNNSCNDCLHQPCFSQGAKRFPPFFMTPSRLQSTARTNTP